MGGKAAACRVPASSKGSVCLDGGQSKAAPRHSRLRFCLGKAAVQPAEPGRGTSPTPERCSGFWGTPFFPARGSHPFQPALKKRGQGQDAHLIGVVRVPGGLHWERVGARGVSGAPVPPAGPSSRSHGDTHHSTSSESYLRSWRISLIASMVLISLRERMETINKAHMEHIIWAASPSPCCL